MAVCNNAKQMCNSNFTRKAENNSMAVWSIFKSKL